ncbi:hypothetical protein NQ318_011379 [Aromia moschata]|uniref:Ecdysteroid UDP-glucosyltransferase n=1 Tax=Aromia moschata TaxID=1265417 RepID=A0AAV8YVJ4_9CUCU|nr:hypothetical protein NQ318_011379 [Aromia moschata]
MRNKYVLRVILLIAVSACTPARCARILGVFPFAARSHYILGNALMRGLAEAGHDVTMISPHEEKNPPQNGSYRDVVLTGFVEDFNDLLKEFNLFEQKQQTIFF